MMAKKN